MDLSGIKETKKRIYRNYKKHRYYTKDCRSGKKPKGQRLNQRSQQKKIIK